MKLEDCFLFGTITRPHGIKGEVEVRLKADDPETYFDVESVFVEIKQRPVPFFVRSIRKKKKDTAIISFEEAESIEEADELRGRDLFLPKDLLTESSEDVLFYHQIEGYSVIDDTYGNIGVVEGVYENPGQDLLVVEKDGNEILIPVVDELISSVTDTDKVVHVNLPEGFLEL